MSDAKDKQPAVGVGKCLNCGEKAAPLIDLCQPCCDRWSDERYARKRALEENGKLRTERLAREAAAKPPDARDERGTRSQQRVGRRTGAALANAITQLEAAILEGRPDWEEVWTCEIRLLREEIESERRNSPTSELDETISQLKAKRFCLFRRKSLRWWEEGECFSRQRRRRGAA